MSTKAVYMIAEDGEIFQTCYPENHKNCTKMTHTKGIEAMKLQTLTTLQEMLHPGDTVYTILRHVAQSGMSREISLCIIENNEPRDITYYVSEVLARKRGKRDGIIMDGCGMDMGFALVYELSRTLHCSRFTCIGKNCPSNDHSNGDRDYTPHIHSDPGYSLRHRWI